MNLEDKYYTIFFTSLFFFHMNILENIYSEKISQGPFCRVLSSRDWENNLLSQIIHETMKKTIVDDRTPTSKL